ncbi:helix-turn-helix transcriptional regulator [Streptomyces boncukensis]|uniref:AAA family ATPase n=1 Tax=Streptomyces boncukensis TaxID=2711219 RepID=A0A6G4WV36_9ACTN|nr:LuxR family transcriptional regulator [Streptomyces boncukensis]NGO68863.1 AAA family ATPase [Streptomyces boncukensis]
MFAENSDIRTRLDELVTDTVAGDSVIAVISGFSAMGKTETLRILMDRASAAGVTVLHVVSSRAERCLPYTTLEKILGLTELSQGRHAEPMGPGCAHAGDLGAVARDACSAIAAATARGPVLIAVDDVQFADEESLHCLQYAAHALRGGGPLALVLTWDPARGDEAPAALRSFLQRPGVRRIRVDVLTVEGIAERLAARWGRRRAAELAPRYYGLTGGNPLLVNALLEDGWSDGPPTGHNFQEAVDLCARRAGAVALEVTRCLAVLGDTRDLSLVGRLSRVGVPRTRRALEQMNAVGLLSGSRFRHPAVASALLAAMPAEALSQVGYRAAQLLYEAGEPTGAVVERLRSVGPLPQEWVLPVLDEAVREALAEHDIRRAISCLQFAVACCTDKNLYYVYQRRIAELYSLIDLGAADARLLALKTPILADELGGAESLRVAIARLASLHFDDALEIIRHVAVSERPTREGERAWWRLVCLTLAANYPGLLDRAGVPRPAELDLDPGAERDGTPLLRTCEALVTVLTRTDDASAMRRAVRVPDEEAAAGEDVDVYVCALLTLVYSDALNDAARWCDRGLGMPEDAPVWRVVAHCFRALVALRQGRLTEAVERADELMAHVTHHEWNDSLGLLLATLIEAHTAAGNHQAAAECVSRPINPALFDTRAGLHYLYARGRHHLAAGRLYGALADFMACGERMRQWDVDTPALAPWRVGAAETWLLLGRRDKAAALIEEQLAWFGTSELLPRAHGATLRCAAALRPPVERPPLLERALGMLQRVDDRYESSRVLADLSQAYHLLGEETKARTAARRARRLTRGHQGKKARPAAAAAAAPPPVPVRAPVPQESGAPGQGDKFAKLSGSERRVALLAAAGYTNREISARIYVTISTVEQHLTRVYRKLGIKRRDELPMDFGAGV